MKRWLKRMGYCAFGLLLLLGLSVAVEHGRGRWMLHHRLGQLRARGEILSSAALRPKPVPQQDNAALDLLSLSNRLGTVMSNLDNTPPTLRFSSPGQAIVVWQMEHWSLDGKTTNDWDQVGVELNKSADLLEQLKGVIEKPGYDTEFDYQTGFVDFKMAPVGPGRNAARLLSVAIMRELARGQLEAANGHLCALIRLAGLQKPEPLIIYQLVRQACAAIAFNATWQALQADGWKDSQLMSLQSVWQTCDFITDMARAMEMERALSLEYLEQIKHSRSILRTVIAQHEQVAETTDGGMGGLVTHGFVLRWIHAPIWRIAWADQGALFDLNEWQVMIERERIARTNGWVVLADRSKGQSLNVPWAPFLKGNENIGFYDKLRLLFADPNLGINDSIVRKTLSMQTQQQMALAAIAINRYRLRTGHLPVTLSDLVPDYLPALPQDFMDGRPLRYRLSSAEDFILYSVGEDGNDDGGDRALRKAKGKYTRIWDGKDAVWPTRATSEDAARALISLQSDP